MCYLSAYEVKPTAKDGIKINPPDPEGVEPFDPFGVGN
jgi:hypothetical protein